MPPELTHDEAQEFWGHIFYGNHHIPSEITPAGFGKKIHLKQSISTFDGSKLTRAVILAHDKCYRLEIQPCYSDDPHDDEFGSIILMLHKRTCREGDFTERHPTIEDAIKSFRGEE